MDCITPKHPPRFPIPGHHRKRGAYTNTQIQLLNREGAATCRRAAAWNVVPVSQCILFCAVHASSAMSSLQTRGAFTTDYVFSISSKYFRHDMITSPASSFCLSHSCGTTRSGSSREGTGVECYTKRMQGRKKGSETKTHCKAGLVNRSSVMPTFMSALVNSMRDAMQKP